jgi:hypothetical protein
VLRTNPGESNQRAQQETGLPGQGDEYPIKHVVDGVNLSISPGISCPCARDLPKRKNRNSIIKAAKPWPINISVTLVLCVPN